MAKKQESLQSRVREALRSAGRMTVREIRDLFGLEGDIGYQRVSGVLRDLARAGYVVRCGQGAFEWQGEPPDLAYSEKQVAMARFMSLRSRNGKPFTAVDVAEKAECSADWAKRYISILKNRQYLAGTGQLRGKTAPRPTYLATEKALKEKPEQWPGIKRQQKTRLTDELVDKIQKLAGELFCLTHSKDLAGKEMLAGLAGKMKGIMDIINEVGRGE